MDAKRTSFLQSLSRATRHERPCTARLSSEDGRFTVDHHANILDIDTETDTIVIALSSELPENIPFSTACVMAMDGLLKHSTCSGSILGYDGNTNTISVYSTGAKELVQTKTSAPNEPSKKASKGSQSAKPAGQTSKKSTKKTTARRG